MLQRCGVSLPPPGGPAINLTDNISRFGSSKEIKTCKELEGSSFFCKGFWPVILDDLNGSFNCKYEVDEEGDVIKHS